MDELGCPAVDKGTNQPNVFHDPKSSESSLPYHSSGRRDDYIQRQYIESVMAYWQDSANNPVSDVYDARMIDMDNAYVWAWDGRPFPAFPNRDEQWSDGDNFRLGHWLNGRSGSRSLASVVSEICQRSGLTAIDVSGLHGVVRGYWQDRIGDGRSGLQPLMLAYGFDAIERDGLLVFRMRDGREAIAVDRDRLAVSGEAKAAIEMTREAEAEMSGRVRLRFVEADGDHELVSEEAVLADDETHAVSAHDTTLSLTRGEGRNLADRWLTEARVGRETARLALPPSLMALGAGDVIDLSNEAGEPELLYRIDRVEQSELQLLEAVRIEPAVYEPQDSTDERPGGRAFAAPVPVTPLFLDLPLMTGDEEPHAPHLALTGVPWPGSAAVYDSASDEDYALNEIIAARSVIGITETPLVAGSPGRFDRGDALQVKLIHGQLQSRPEASVLNGGNLAAIGDGSSGNWELFQFATAQLIAPDTYLLSDRLRGQLGSDALTPVAWPAGSWFVLLDGTPEQIGLKSVQRRIARHYRIGPAQRGYDDPSYTHLVEAFDGNGLRPYSPAHLRTALSGSGDITVSWIRRTRIDGDSWDQPEVPLGEESESYLLRVTDGGQTLRGTTLSSPSWTYTQAEQSADGAGTQTQVEVAQLSARFGPGLFARATLPL